MYKKELKKVVALFTIFNLLFSTFTYADTVVIGSAPGTNDGRTMSANASTAYLQNQYTGPGLAPNSSLTGLTPIQGVNYQQSNGQNPVAYGANEYIYTTKDNDVVIIKENGNNKYIYKAKTDEVINNVTLFKDGYIIVSTTKGETVIDLSAMNKLISDNIINLQKIKYLK